MRLARGLRPPTLTTSGLRGALAELAARGPVPVDLTVPEPAPEVAAYFICSEALANAAKYAAASNVQVRIVDEDTRMIVEVADDGIGSQPRTRIGTPRDYRPRSSARPPDHD